MTKIERKQIQDYACTLTDEQLKNEYYDSVYGSLGSNAERMYELGYDIRDIMEEEKRKEYASQRADILENECCKRNIKLWGEE